tara:strand:+ start:1012 stop:1203 length:192 start_codon:yes stop_codon:yes gene_type:complete
MENKYYKFHFKNDRANKAKSFDVENLQEFTDALKYAYEALDNLNKEDSGYRIIGIYEILYPHN